MVRKLVPLPLTLVLLFVFLSGCASPVQETLQVTLETVATATVTPDPLYALNCLHQSGRAHFCYAGAMLLEDYDQLEKSIVAFCNSKIDFACSVMVWKDEASVAEKVPLTEEDIASRVARYSFPGNGTECFQVYDNGEVIFESGTCP